MEQPAPPPRDQSDEERYISNDARKTYFLEGVFEKMLWSSRFLVLFAVVASVIASLALFVIGSMKIIDVVRHLWDYYINAVALDLDKLVIGEIIGSIDIFLIAVVLLLFSFGLYELFISHIDEARKTEASGILKITSLDVLKDKIAQVIIMALIVKFFQMVLDFKIKEPLEMVFFAGAVLFLATSLFFLHLGKK